MDIALDLVRLALSLAAAAGILYGIYRGLRWRFPRLGAFRARLIVGLGAIFLVAASMNQLTTSGAQCVGHENTVLLRGERIINLRQAEVARPTRNADSPHYANVLKSCAFLIQHCPLDGADETGVTTARICEMAAAGIPLN
jgi:hypothetical protein